MNDTVPKYCSQCGAPCPPNARFCGRCGSPMLPPPGEQASQSGHVPTAAPQPPVSPQPTYSPPPPAYQQPPAYGQPAYPPPPQPYPQQPPAYGQPAYPPPPQPYPQPPAYGQPGYPLPPQAYPQPARRRRSGRGCMWGCLGTLLVLGLVVGGVVLWRWLAPPRSNIMALGKRVAIVSQTIPSSGGALAVQQAGSAIDGLTIGVPSGAYQEDLKFAVSVRPIDGHRLGSNFDPLTPLIRIDNGHRFASEPMTVEIPIQIADNEFAMAFFYDERTGKLEGIPTVSLTPSRITLLTSHFSDLVVSRVSLASLLNGDVDTGFAPGVDDWQFVNDGSYIAPAGHCAGQALSAMWYYYEKRLGAGERPLYGRWDNNNFGYGTIDFQWDDSWGYRLASVVQRSQWDEDHGRAVLTAIGTASDYLTWYSFAYAMQLTGEPQYVAIGRYVPDATGKQVRRGHAIVAYRIDGDRMWVADPNYPGKDDRFIRFENGAFLPYASGDRATDIAANGVRIYPEIRYLAKTALVDWNAIGTEYDRMLKGKAGEGYFPNELISYLVEVDPTTGQTTWADLPEVLELDEEATAKAGEQYRGKLVVGIGMNQAFVAEAYDGTTRRETQNSDAAHKASFVIPLTPGVNDVGLYIRNFVGGAAEYTDFRRYKVLYERPDLSGTWTGTWRIHEIVNFRRYIEDWLADFLLWIGLAETEAQAHEAAAAGIVEAPNLYADRALTIVLQAVDPDKGDRYRAQTYIEGDSGEIFEYTGEATFKDGVFQVETRAQDGTKLIYTGQLTGNDHLAGDFTATVWLVVKDALSGSWEMTRQEP